MARVRVKDWSDVRETASPGLKLDLCIDAGILDAHVLSYFIPDEDRNHGIYELRPDLETNIIVTEMFFDWDQVRTKREWNSDAVYWFIFTHPAKQLPCIVEFRTYELDMRPSNVPEFGARR